MDWHLKIRNCSKHELTWIIEKMAKNFRDEYVENLLKSLEEMENRQWLEKLRKGLDK